MRLLALLLCFGLLVALRAWGQWKRDVALAKMRTGFVEAQRSNLVRRIVQAPWEQLAAMDHAHINNLVGSDVPLMGGCVHFILQGTVAFCMLACQWGLAIALSPLLAGVAGVLMLVSGFVLYPQLIRSRALGRETVKANLALAARGAHFFAGLKLAISQNMQDRFAQEFTNTMRGLLSRQIDFLRQQSRAQVSFTVLSSLAAAGALLLGISILDTPPSVLIVFVVLLARMAGPAAQLQQGLQQFVNFLPSYERMWSLQAQLNVEKRPSAPKNEGMFNGPIRLCNVSYRHPSGRVGVRGVDLIIEPGSFVGVTGVSGSGKSSFSDLLVGLTAPQTGAITISGRSLADGLVSAWRSAVGYAPQETFLFNGTIRQNMEWTASEKGDAALWQALRVAGAETVVRSLDGGLDAVSGENGHFLSGGERQRIAIARMLLRQAPLLVLDEATSAIDVASEGKIVDRLLTLPWRPTIVLIAHRRESLSRCDRLLVFSHGRIVEDRHVRRPADIRC
jgi:ATP-binding cassette subfamily C protein